MTKRHLTRWLVLNLALLCCTATAAAENDVGFEAGVRAGIGIPFGEVGETQGDLDDAAALQIPLQLDVGVRLFGSWFVGAYLQYGFAIISDDLAGCDDSDLLDVDCSGSDVRLGIQVHYHFMPRNKLDPWLGLGFGYEWATLNLEGGNVKIAATYSGFEFFALQFGLDIEISKHVRLGPFLSFSLAVYDDVSVECSGNNFCGGGFFDEIQETTMHEWLMLGVRASFGT